MLGLSGVQGSVKKPQPRTATKPQAFLVTNFVSWTQDRFGSRSWLSGLVTSGRVISVWLE